MLKKIGWILGLLAVAAGIGMGVWYALFNKDIFLPDAEVITKIEVRQNDFEQKAQQVTFLEDAGGIGKVYDFIHQRRTGWERLLVTPPGVAVLVHFYKGDKALFHLYLLQNDRLLIGNKDGAFSRNLHKVEREELQRLLGIPAAKTDKVS
jgi:hypothetical protein